MSFSESVPTLFTRYTYADPAEHTALLSVFIALQILGLIGSIALNFFTSWIISTVSYSLLALSGQLNKPNPAFGVCLAQAGLIYGIPSLTAATTLGLITQIWFNVRALLMQKVKNERIWTIVILVIPYVVLFSMVIASWVVGMNKPSLVRVIGSGMYCHIVRRASAALVALMLLPTLTLEIMICVALRRNWSTFRRMKQSMSIILRVMIFTFFGILAISLSGIFVFTDSHGAALNIVFAAMPVAAVVVFATQKDIIATWMFWKKRSQPRTKSIDSSRSSDASSPV
ncbi:hypothetical protein C8J57DRAFT_1373993 [Mycena rebaudengoi]|nr:hypothetical protein C8J57DRAFT_1373993 [Mycena rebaudengoi]